MTSITFDDVNIVPAYSDIEHRSEVDISARLVGNINISIPVIPANMDTICGREMIKYAVASGSFGFYHRFDSHIDRVNTIKDLSNMNIRFGISVGVSNEERDFLYNLRDECGDLFGVPFLIDVAHGHHELVFNMIDRIRGTFPSNYIIAGNVATYDGAKALISWGADGIKVGIGNGGLCSTRVMTGIGVPQITAISECRRAIDDYCNDDEKMVDEIIRGCKLERPTLISDGGVKMPGDVVKALAAGADVCMSGYLFAGTDETPGDVILSGMYPNERRMKIYRGSASRSSKSARGENNNIEGGYKEIPIKGPVGYIFDGLYDGIRSGFSYVGARNAKEFRNNAKLIRVSTNSVIEAHPNFMYMST